MPVCIAGMHRSGTSMVARLLNLCGMYLGPEKDLIGPESDNLEGFWEHRHFVALNDALLDTLGGAWDIPPQAGYEWEQTDAVTQLRSQGERLLGHFRGQSKWGWKDPRNSLTVAFWKSLIPEMRVVICLRNPFEVARSLNKRGYSSMVFGFDLWYEYNRSVLSNIPAEQRLITHFENYFRSPREELVRVIRWLGWETPDHVIEQAVASVSQKLRHNTATSPLSELKEAPQRVMELYRKMCSESEDQIKGHPDALLKSEHEQLQLKILQQEERLSERDRQHGQLQLKILQQEERLSEKDRQHEQLQLKIRQQEATLAEKDREIGRMNDLASKVDALSAQIESLRAELLSRRRFFCWNEYDAVYQVWKQYRKGKIRKQEALEIIRVNYGVRSFFLLYPLYKTVKPLRKCKNHLAGFLWRYDSGRQTAQVKSESGINPLLHYVTRGAAEVRKSRPTSGIFCSSVNGPPLPHRAIAFYLPQFHPIPENDEWWGKDFTEWTNVAKAEPVFEGHYQPHIPGELGYYDLRDPQARKSQAELAKEHGIYGFCYYHYWFNGKLLLNSPLDEVLRSGEPDFPFCLCWANENWTRAWDGGNDQILIKQNYNHEDDLRHILYLNQVFKDRRYIRINGKPLFLVYRACRMPDPNGTAKIWRKQAKKCGVADLYLCRVESFPDEHTDPRTIGFDASVEFQPDWTNLSERVSLPVNHSVYRYEEVVDRMVRKSQASYLRFPCVTPSWDNSPRRKDEAVIFIDSRPEIYEKWLRAATRKLGVSNPEERILFINAWNEWGEGNHLEPDARNGRAYLEATKRALSRKLVFKKFDKPLVTVIVPVYDQWKYTYSCLLSLAEECGDTSFEVIVADDHSGDETTNILDYIENIKVSRNEKNLGFLKNCNNAARFALGKYIVFLNNDTVVTKGWLKYLVELMERDGKVGLVGSKIIFPDGSLQEAGGIIWRDGSAANYGRSDDPDKPEYNYVKEVDYVSGASIMVRKDLWEEIGGFDEAFSPAYYEDTDLAFAIRKRGYKVMLHPKSIIVHFEGISHGTDLKSGVKRYQVDNQRKFLDKWRRTLYEMHEADSGHNLFHARDRSRAKKTLLVIDNSVPDYDKHAGSRTIFQYLKLFTDMGFNVKFIDDNSLVSGTKYERYVSALECLGIEVLYGEWCGSNWQNWIKDHVRYLDYVYLHKPFPSIKYIDAFRNDTKAIIIYNCADFHYLRKLRQYKITKDLKDLEEAREYRKIEFHLFDQSDIVFTYSEHEKSILDKKMPHKRVHITPLFFYDQKFPLGANNAFENRSGLSFVGGFAHTPNIDAVQWFIEEVFPRILAKNPDMKFNIIGSNPPDEILQLRSENINIAGFVSDQTLERYYSTSKLMVAPIRFGAGVKGKVIEAIAHGTPVVTTGVGMEGIHDADGAIDIGNTGKEFASRVLELYYDEGKWSTMQSRQIEYANKHLTMEYARDLFAGILRK